MDDIFLGIGRFQVGAVKLTKAGRLHDFDMQTTCLGG
jgi:hypothetical protein